MAAIKKSLTRKAIALTARHSARGTASKVKRSPVRVATLLGLGGAVGALAGFLAGRSAASAGAGS